MADDFKGGGRLITERQAATFLGVSPATLRVWRCTRRVQLPFVKVGRAVRYDERDLLAFVTANRRGEVAR